MSAGLMIPSITQVASNAYIMYIASALYRITCISSNSVHKLIFHLSVITITRVPKTNMPGCPRHTDYAPCIEISEALCLVDTEQISINIYLDMDIGTSFRKPVNKPVLEIVMDPLAE